MALARPRCVNACVVSSYAQYSISKSINVVSLRSRLVAGAACGHRHCLAKRLQIANARQVCGQCTQAHGFVEHQHFHCRPTLGRAGARLLSSVPPQLRSLWTAVIITFMLSNSSPSRPPRRSTVEMISVSTLPAANVMRFARPHACTEA